MLKIGITGGIGSGKSIVCKIFSSIGIPVYDSDYHAKRLYDSDPILKSQMINIFGENIYTPEGLNKKRLAEILFSDDDKLGIINKIVPETIFRDFDAWAETKNAPYVIMESAIIFDVGIDIFFDYVIAVSAPYKLRLSRSMQRNNSSEESIIARMEKQLNPDIVNAKANFVVENNEVYPLLPQVLKIDKNLKEFQSK